MHRVEDVTHKVKVSVLWYLPVVGEDVLGLDVVAGLLLRLVVVVVLLLLGCLVRVLLVKIVHERGTYGLLGSGVPCGGGGGRVSNHEGRIYKSTLITHKIDRNKKEKTILDPFSPQQLISPLTPHGSLVFLLLLIVAVDDHGAQV